MWSRWPNHWTHTQRCPLHWAARRVAGRHTSDSQTPWHQTTVKEDGHIHYQNWSDCVECVRQEEEREAEEELVSWCFEPSQPQMITSGLNTNFTLFPSYSFHKSSYHKSCFFVVVFLPIYIPRALNTGTCLRKGDLFYSAGLHRNHVLATANTEKNRVLEKCGWMD